MKKYISMFAMALTLSWGFTACSVETDETPGGTAIQNMCGYWDVQIDAVDASGKVFIDTDGDAWYDPFSIGVTTLYTYNTASNSATEMWIEGDGKGSFYDFKFKAPIDYAAGSFTATNIPYDPDEQEIADSIAAGNPILDDDGVTPLVPGTATITDAKIMLGVAKNLHGMPCDSISFIISFSDDKYPAQYGYAAYRVYGTRHTGFTE